MKVLFYIDKDTQTVREIPRTPEREKSRHFYETRKEAVQTLYRNLCEKADVINARVRAVKTELTEIVIAESEKKGAR